MIVASALLLSIGVGCSDENAADLKVTVAADVTEGSAPLLVQFSAAIEGGTAPFIYVWNFGDGTNTTGDTVASHRFETGGKFPVTLSVVDSAGKAANAQVLVTVAANGIPQARISATATIGVVPMTASFTANVVGGDAPFTYVWSFCDGTTAATQVIAHDFVTAGSCAVQLKVTDSNGDTAEDAVTVSIASNEIPAVEVTADGIVKVRLKGARGSCPMSTMTLKMGIERAMKEQIPAVKEVVQVP